MRDARDLDRDLHARSGEWACGPAGARSLSPGPFGAETGESRGTFDRVAHGWGERGSGAPGGDSRYKHPVPRREELTLAPDFGGCAPRSFVTQRTKGEFGAARPQSEGYQHSSPDARRSSALPRWVEADVRGHGVSPQSLIIGFSVDERRCIAIGRGAAARC